MFQFRMNFVLELFAVDGTAPSAGSRGIAGLKHEVGDNAVEYDVIIVAFLRQGCKIIASLGQKFMSVCV